MIARHHVGKECTGKCLGNRADLENRARIECGLAVTAFVVCDDACPAIRFQQTNHDAGSASVVNSLLDDRVQRGIGQELRVAGKWKCAGKPQGQRRNDGNSAGLHAVHTLFRMRLT